MKLSLRTIVLICLMLTLVLALDSSSAVASEPTIIHVSTKKKAKSQPLSHSLQLFLDQTRKHIPEDILTPEIQSQFKDLAGDDVYQFKRGHFWLRAVIHNDDPEAAEYRLVHDYSFTDQIRLYRLENQHIVPYAQRGDQIPSKPEDNDYRLPAFHLTLPPGSSTFYILVDTVGPVNLTFTLVPVADFVSNSRKDYLLLGVLFGFVIVMVGYNIFLAARLHTPSYYFYVGYITCFGIVQFLFTGTAQYLLPSSSLTYFFLNHGIILSAELTAIFGALFAMSFLNIKESSPLLYKAMLCFFPLSIIDVGLSFYDFNLALSFVLFTNFYISLVLLVSGVQGCLRRYRPAYFFLSAWIFLIVGSMITMGRIYGLLPNTMFTTWSQFFGGALELILLSVAMGDKMSLIQEESHQKISKLASNLNLANNQLQDHIDNVEAIVDEKTRDIKSMLSNIQQGIFMISSKDSMIMPDYSDHLAVILNTQTIAGRSVRDIIFSRSDLSQDCINQTESVIMNALGDTELNFEVNQELLVRELLFTFSDSEKVLELEWSAICNDVDVVEKILVTVRDVTQMRELERKQLKQQHELEAIGKVLKVPADKFMNFIGTCQEFMRSCHRTLNAEAKLNLKAINLVFMNVHTMKGMARTFRLDDLANALHEFEDHLEPFRHKPDAMMESTQLLDFLKVAEDRVMFYSYINGEKLGRKPQGKTELEQHNWIRSKVKKLRSIDTNRMNAEEAAIIRQVIDEMEHRYGMNLEKALESLLQGLPATANTLGKAAPQVIFEHDEILLTSAGQILAERTFVHLLNNSIDHGIESIEARMTLGKPIRGQIRIKTWMDGSDMMVSMQDDGYGLNLQRVYKKALEQGLIHSPEPAIQDLANLIFEAGFSTKDEASMTSGRGVGMDAVRTYLVNSNSTIAIKLLDTQRLSGDLKPIAFRFEMRLDAHLFLLNSTRLIHQVA